MEKLKRKSLFDLAFQNSMKEKFIMLENEIKEMNDSEYKGPLGQSVTRTSLDDDRRIDSITTMCELLKMDSTADTGTNSISYHYTNKPME